MAVIFTGLENPYGILGVASMSMWMRRLQKDLHIINLSMVVMIKVNNLYRSLLLR